MTARSRLLQSVGASVGVFLVDVWPVLVIWRAGASGSVGDLSEVHFLGLGLAVSAAIAVVAGWAMAWALRFTAESPQLGRFDAWGAYALGVGVYSVALIVVPAIMFVFLLADEDDPLRRRMWLVDSLWVGSHLLAAVPAFLAARWLLGRRPVKPLV